MRSHIKRLDPYSIALIDPIDKTIELYSNSISELDTLWSVRYRKYPISESYESILKHMESNMPLVCKIRSTKRYEWSKSTCEYATLEFAGASREVGASCFVLNVDNSKFILDAGYGFYLTKAPVIEDLDLNQVNGIFLSHAHADHCCFVPELFRNNYKGPIYATLPTMLLYYNTCTEYLKTEKEPRYTKEDFYNSLLAFEILDCSSRISLGESIEFKFNEANHTLGSVMVEFIFKRAYKKPFHFLYTGDYKNDKAIFYPAIQLKKNYYDAIVAESTYGNEDREVLIKDILLELRSNILERLSNNGYVLMPVFSNARILELLYYIHKINLLDKVYVPLKQKNLFDIFTDCKNMFNKGFTLLDKLATVKTIRQANGLRYNIGPSIIVAPSGMLEGGPALQIFKEICEDPESMIYFSGFVSKNALGSCVLTNNPQLTLLQRNKQSTYDIKLKILQRSLASGHTFFSNTREFLTNTIKEGGTLYLVHGAAQKALALRAALLKDATKKFKVRVPHIREKYRLF
jgi:predicted metal-dependent RNase